MADADNALPLPAPQLNFLQTSLGRNIALGGGIAALMAIILAVWMWGQGPEYRVLFSNFSDRDGGAIVASLQQQNIPYKFSDGGNAILVPASQVYDARLRLAAQGLPKGGNVGFELMENQKLGISQFLEQVNFQRALEGELARSIQSLGPVSAARVHLALPKQTLFVREQQKPTASVIVNLNQGRTLEPQQVSAIVHLVASSVPDLPTKNVTVVDQTGNMLSETSKGPGANALDPSQLKYVQDLQMSIIKRVESIISTIVGPGNVRAEATADVDFSHVEQANEIYGPNQPPNAAAVRSQQSSEANNGAGAAPAGVPGALSNQPPAPATAPITGTTAANASGGSNSARKDMTTNFEVDKTIRYTQQSMGGIKRLSVGVVVNYKREVDKNGKVTNKALTEEEKAQITDLVKEAMGYNKDRGDTLNVVNSPFAMPEKEVIEEAPLWQQPWILTAARDGLKYAAAAVVVLYLFFGILRPLLRKLAGPTQEEIDAAIAAAAEEARIALEAEQAAAADEEARLAELEPDPMGPKSMGHESNLEAARALARDDPRMVANIIKEWVGAGAGNE